MLHTVEDKRRLAQKISERLSKSPEVRPFPATVTRLASACQDPNANSRKFESIIECDPALSVKILRLANSPLFCPSSRVKSVAHAVSLLGLRKLKSVAMSVAGATMFSNGDGARVQRQKLWSHSVGCAVVARNLAAHVKGIDEEEAFLAGVFHDIGKLLFYDTIPDEYSDVDASFSGLPLIEEEEFLFGTTHESVGLASAYSWNLPSAVTVAIGWHHRPDHADTSLPFAKALHSANRMAKHWGIGSEPVVDPDLVNEIGAEYGLTEEQ